MFSFSKIYFLVDNLIKFFNSILFLLILIGLTFSLLLSPPDYLQGENVRIMYVHVPSSWISLSCFMLIAFLSIINFIFKIKNLHLVKICLAPIGLMFTCLSIVTGAIWGQPTWGTWWAWDARLTSMLALMFFYLLLIINYKFFEKDETSQKISSIISIIGLVNIPIIKYSVEWWNTLHQPASINILSKSSIHSSMLFPLIIMTAAFALFSLLIFLMKYNTELIKIKNKGLDRL